MKFFPMIFRIGTASALLAAGTGRALGQATPISAELKADGITRITCE